MALRSHPPHSCTACTQRARHPSHPFHTTQTKNWDLSIVNVNKDLRTNKIPCVQVTPLLMPLADRSSLTLPHTQIGCVAWPGMAEPPPSLVRCVRADLVGPVKVHNAPLWQGVSSDNKFWAASLWLMDTPLSTFLASKNAMRPPPGMPRVPMY